MASVCALREYETEETCKKECEFYKENGICSEEYDISFCAYQNNTDFLERLKSNANII